MKILKLLFIIISLFFSMNAMALSDADKTQLQKAVDDYVTAFNAGDMKKALSYMPRPYLKNISKFFDQTDEETLETIIDDNVTALEAFDEKPKYKLSVSLKNMKLQKTATNKEFVTLKRVFLASMMDTLIENTGNMFAIQEQGKWKLVHIASFGDVNALIEAYDDIKSIDTFPVNSKIKN